MLSAHISSVQLLSHVQLFATPWTAAHQAFLSITNSQSLLKLTSMESVMPSNHLVLCHPLSSCLQSFPASGSFPMSQFFASGGQSSGVSASASVLPMNIQDWFPLGWTGDLFVVQRTLKSLLQYHSSKAHIKPTHTLISGPSLTMQGQKIFPAQPGGGTDDGSMTSTKEWQRKSSPYFPLFLWLKTVAH